MKNENEKIAKNEKKYISPRLIKHSKIKSKPAEIFTTCCCGGTELI